MPAEYENRVTVSDEPSKSVQLLRKRLRQLLRVLVVLAACVAVAAAALAIWWLNSLNGLPDIGDPFDVAAFRAFRLPDEQNAFTYLRRASEKLTPIVGMEGGNGADPTELTDSRVADSAVSAHLSRDVARGRRRPPSDPEAGSGASHRRVRHSVCAGLAGGAIHCSRGCLLG